MAFPGLTRAQITALITTGLTGYYTSSQVDTLLTGKAASAHDHNDLYFTEAEITTLMSGKADAGHTHDYSAVFAALVHTHDDRYFTESEVTALFAGKADTAHTHSATSIVSDVLDNARINWAAPSTIGGTTPPAATFNPVNVSAGVTNQKSILTSLALQFTQTSDGSAAAQIYNDQFDSGQIGLRHVALRHMFYDRTNSKLMFAVSDVGALHSESYVSFRRVINMETWDAVSNLTQSILSDSAAASADAIIFNRSTRASQINTRYITSWKYNNIEVAHIANDGQFVTKLVTPNTAAVDSAMIIGANSTGTPNAGLGAALEFTLESTTTPDRRAGRLRAEWTNANDASRRSKTVLSFVHSGVEYDGLTVSGTGFRIEHYNASPVAYFQFEPTASDGRQTLIHQSDAGSSKIIQARGGVKSVVLGPATAAGGSVSMYGMTGNIAMSDVATIIPIPIFSNGAINSGTHKGLFISTPETGYNGVGSYTRTDMVDLFTLSFASNALSGVRANMRYTALEHIFRVDGSAGLNNAGTEVLRVKSGEIDVTGTLHGDGLRLDLTPTAETITPTHTITVSINGTNYKIPLVAA